MATIGTVLKSARTKQGFTLKQVEESTGISNAYLSQLENDKIKSPAINVLYKLSSIFGIPLKQLLQDAGLIEKEQETKNSQLDEFVKRIAFSAKKMSDAEREMVMKYLEFIISQKKQEKDA